MANAKEKGKSADQESELTVSQDQMSTKLSTLHQNASPRDWCIVRENTLLNQRDKNKRSTLAEW